MHCRIRVLAGCTAAAAVAIAAVPAPSAAAPAVGVDTAGTSLLLFDTATPGTMTPVPITGLGVGETIAGIDRRPATGALYGLGVVDGGAMDALRLYRIDTATGTATSISLAPVTAQTGGTDYGVDFTPFVDRLRVVNDANENLRLNPNNGTLAGDDPNLTDAGPDADSRPIEGVAFSNNVAPPFGVGAGVTSTTEFGIAPFTDELVTIGGFGGATPGGPNSGIVGDEKPLGFNAGFNVNFDIADFSGLGFLTSGTNFGTVNLGTGAFTLIGSLAQALDGFSVLPANRVTLDPRSATTSEAAGAVTLTLTRTNTASPASVRVTTEQLNLGVPETDTAVSGSDFKPLDARVNFVGDQAQATVTIPIVADDTAEGEEAFTVFLAEPGANTGLGVDTALAADRATVTIAADPGPPPPPPEPPVQAPALDKTGPFAVLIPGARSLKRSALAARGLGVRYVCGEPCGATFTLKLSKRTLGTAKAKLSTAGLGSARVRLTRAGTRALVAALKRRPSVRTTLSATLTDAAGNPTSKSSRITIKR